MLVEYDSFKPKLVKTSLSYSDFLSIENTDTPSEILLIDKTASFGQVKARFENQAEGFAWQLALKYWDNKSCLKKISVRSNLMHRIDRYHYPLAQILVDALYKRGFTECSIDIIDNENVSHVFTPTIFPSFSQEDIELSPLSHAKSLQECKETIEMMIPYIQKKMSLSREKPEKKGSFVQHLSAIHEEQFSNLVTEYAQLLDDPARVHHLLHQFNLFFFSHFAIDAWNSIINQISKIEALVYEKPRKYPSGHTVSLPNRTIYLWADTDNLDNTFLDILKIKTTNLITLCFENPSLTSFEILMKLASKVDAFKETYPIETFALYETSIDEIEAQSKKSYTKSRFFAQTKSEAKIQDLLKRFKKEDKHVIHDDTQTESTSSLFGLSHKT